ncbi:hypothetical protein EW026_g1015 [Hermanssonia centrifuga]|uniref:Uncharacterized protein n=1 Tax=Hermanssonia centrifuga TaxID=98765 RepID=A0A4S4KUN3_9APHY|nr:hypothetical protein EW026_g1015 [Hermanssonia centrifuga]
MSSYGAPTNPDTRPLPPGWVQQYDSNYKAWFYVNTAINPPQPSWVHPLGAPPPIPSPQGFAPPPGPPPPDNRGYNSSPYPGQGGYNQSPPPQQSWNSGPGYGGGYGGYQGPPQEQRGWFGGGRPQQPPQQVVYEQAPPKKSGMGMGTAIAAGGVGLIGGALLADAFEDHEDREEQQAYDQGYDNGQDNNYDDGGGGGDW